MILVFLTPLFGLGLVAALMSQDRHGHHYVIWGLYAMLCASLLIWFLTGQFAGFVFEAFYIPVVLPLGVLLLFFLTWAPTRGLRQLNHDGGSR